MSQIPGVADLGTFQVRGQPNVNLVVDRAAADRFGINVSDIQDAVETAVGGKAVSQILIGEQRYDLPSATSSSFARRWKILPTFGFWRHPASGFRWASVPDQTG